MEDLGEWADMEERAISFMWLNPSDEELLDVMDEEFAPGLWAKVKRLYMTAHSSNGSEDPCQFYA